MKLTKFALIFLSNTRTNSGDCGSALCLNSTLDPSKVAGKIVACERGVSGRVEKGGIVKAAGAAGMILANNAASGAELLADPHLLPATMITYTDGLKLFAYINSTRSVLNLCAYINNTKSV